MIVYVENLKESIKKKKPNDCITVNELSHLRLSLANTLPKFTEIFLEFVTFMNKIHDRCYYNLYVFKLLQQRVTFHVHFILPEVTNICAQKA